MRPACLTACIRNICASCSSTTTSPRAGSKPAAGRSRLKILRAPIFAVGTERDHVAPWRSTYKIFLQVESDVTYLLTAGGHNAGIVSEPGHHGRTFRVATKKLTDHYVDPDSYLCEHAGQGRVVVAGMGRLAEGSLRPADRRARNGRAASGISAARRRAGPLRA